MTEYDNTNRGVLFKNDRKDSDKHPDYKGSIDVGGVEHWLSAWIKKSKDGSKTFLSLSVTPKDKQARGSSAPSNSAPASGPVLDDEIPFMPEWR